MLCFLLSHKRNLTDIHPLIIRIEILNTCGLEVSALADFYAYKR